MVETCILDEDAEIQIEYEDEVVLLMFASLRDHTKYFLGLKSEIYEALTQIRTPDITLTRKR